MTKKSLKSISWDVTEEQYRSDPAFSYSQIATFFRKGPASLIKQDKEDTASLRGGSLVDTLLTAPEEFNDKFFVSSVPTPSENTVAVLNEILKQGIDTKIDLEHIPDNVKLQAMNKHGFYNYWKDPTRLNKLNTDGYEYYRLLALGTIKTIVSTDEKAKADLCVQAIMGNPTTSVYFTNNPFDKDTENLYQLKFKTNFSGQDVRCMFDIIRVDHKNKLIFPRDLKTTGENEEHFEHSFLKWCYFIQGELYTAILKQILSNDEYYKDFTVMPFGFLVVNKDNLSPMEWIITEETSAALSNAGYPTTWELISEMRWHFLSGVFKYKKDTYESNFSKTLTLKFLKNE